MSIIHAEKTKMPRIAMNLNPDTIRSILSQFKLSLCLMKSKSIEEMANIIAIIYKQTLLIFEKFAIASKIINNITTANWMIFSSLNKGIVVLYLIIKLQQLFLAILSCAKQFFKLYNNILL